MHLIQRPAFNLTDLISRFFSTLSDTFFHFIHPLTLLHILSAAVILCVGNFAEALVPLTLYLELPRYVFSPIYLFAYLLAFSILAGKALEIASKNHNEEPLSAEDLRTYRIGIALLLLVNIFVVTALHQVYKYDDLEIHIHIIQISTAVILVLLPLCGLAFLQNPTSTSLFDPRALMRAWRDIGWWRYLLVTTPGILLNLILPPYLSSRYLPQSFTIFTPDILLSIVGFHLILFACWLLAILYPTCYYPSADDDDTDNTRDTGDEHKNDSDAPAPQGFAARLRQAEAHIQAGDIAAACALLSPYTDAQHDPAIYHPAYRLLYPIAPSDALRTRLINAAISGSSESYDIIAADLARLDPAQLPPGHILPLIKQAYIGRDYASVLNLTRNFAKNHPTHPHLVENYYLAALALAKSGAADKALSLLQQLHTRYPDHPQAEQIRRAVTQLQGSGQK